MLDSPVHANFKAVAAGVVQRARSAVHAEAHLLQLRERAALIARRERPACGGPKRTAGCECGGAVSGLERGEGEYQAGMLHLLEKAGVNRWRHKLIARGVISGVG